MVSQSSVSRINLQQLLDGWLQAVPVSDYCPNGLQVEGRPEIRRLVTGVTASLAFLEAAIDAGADDVVDSGDTLEVYTDFKQLIAIRQVLVAANLTVTNVEKVMRPKTLVQATGPDALKALKLIDRLEELDDVQKVYSNLDITDELAEQFADA